MMNKDMIKLRTRGLSQLSASSGEDLWKEWDMQGNERRAPQVKYLQSRSDHMTDHPALPF